MTDGQVLRIEPGAAERIAKAFHTHADNLEAVAHRLRSAGHSTGFAGFPSAIELDAGFRNKARLAITHLEQQVKMVRGHAESIRAAGAAYSDTDTSGAASIHASANAIDTHALPR